MPFLIDGHNLIPYMHGMSLDQLDDEIRLIDFLDAYFRRIRKKAIIFFDKGLPINEPLIKRSFVSARFIRPPLIADQAIRNQLNRLGGSAKNYTVVSSDNEVTSFAQHKGAKILSSQEFAVMVNSPQKSGKTAKSAPDDLEYWLKLFGGDS